MSSEKFLRQQAELKTLVSKIREAEYKRGYEKGFEAAADELVRIVNDLGKDVIRQFPDTERQ